MRVLHLTERLGFAGAGANLPLYLKFANHDLFDVTMGSFFGSDQRRKEILEGDGIRTQEFYGEMELFERYLKDQDIDILHISGGELPGGHLKWFVEIAKRRVRVPIIIHLNFFAHGDGDGIDLTLLQSKTMAWKYMRKNGLSVEEFWLRSRLLPVPIDLERFDSLKPSEEEVRQIKKRLGIDGHPTICRLGRPDPIKWSYFLLQILALVKARIPNVKLVVVGGIPDNVKNKIKSMHLAPSVVDVGEVSDNKVIKILHCVDVLTHSSRIGESFTAAIPQAMACRKPVVVNSTPWADNGQIEQIDKWVDGLVATTAEDFADHVIRLLKNPFMRQRMGQNGRSKVKSSYEARLMTRLLEKFYVELALKKGLPCDGSAYSALQPFGVAELSGWPLEYAFRLRESGYNAGRVKSTLTHYLWKSTLLFPSLREAIPADGILASII